MTVSKPLNDLRNLFKKLPVVDVSLIKNVNLHNVLTNEDIRKESAAHLIEWLATWQGDIKADISQTHLCVIASNYNQLGDTQRVLNFIDQASKGQALVNKLCKEHGLGLRVLEMAPTIPHDTNKNWSEADCMAAVAFGMEATAADGHLLGLTALAPGNDEVCIKLINKLKALQDEEEVTQALALAENIDALDVMRQYGGREIAGLVGAILAARLKPMPILIEGWSAIAAMHIVKMINPTAIDHIQVAAVADKNQYDCVLATGKMPILGQYVDFGVGCGLALAVSTISSLRQLIK